MKFLEEAVNVPLGGTVDELTTEKGKKLFGEGGIFDWKEMLRNGLQGMAMGLILGGVGAISGTVQAYQEAGDIQEAVGRLNRINNMLPESFRAQAVKASTATEATVGSYAQQVAEGYESFMQAEEAAQAPAQQSAGNAAAAAQERSSAALKAGTGPRESGAPAAAQSETQQAAQRSYTQEEADQSYRLMGMARAASAFGEHGAKALEAVYDGETDAAQFYAGFANYYQAGVNGTGMGSVKGAYSGTLTEAQRYAAYSAGQNDAAASLQAEKKAAGYAQVAGDDSGLVYDDFVREAVESGRTMTDKDGEVRTYLRAETAATINRVAKALGLRVQFADSVRGGTANAQISGSRVLIEKNNENPVRFLIGHEITHRLQKLAPTAYRSLRNTVAQERGAQVQQRLREYAAEGVAINIEQAMDEVAADYVGALVQDGRALEDFISQHRENRTMLQKLRDAIVSILDKLTGREKLQAKSAVEKLNAALEAAAKQAERLQRKGGNGTMEATRYSAKKYWSPDLTQQEWSLLNRHMEQEIGDSAHALDEATQWAYANEKGVQVFALYGIGDGTEATVLYASGGKTAAADYQAFMKYGEEFDHGADRSGEAFNRLFKALRREQRQSNGNLPDAQRRSTENGHDRVSAERAGNDGRKSTGHGQQTGGEVNTRFSLKAPVEETDKLLALHNKDESSILAALKLGGLPMPSIAVVKATMGHSKYGPISLVFNKATIDPEANSANRVYGGDAWTPTAPQLDYEVNSKRASEIERELHRLSGDVSVAGGIFGNSAALRSMGIDESSTRNTAELAEKLAQTDTVRAAYLADQGKSLESVKKDKVWDRRGNDTLQAVIDRLGADTLAEMEAKLELGESGKDALGENAEAIRDILRDYYREQGEAMLRRMAVKRGWTDAEINEKRQARIDKSMDEVSIFTLEDIVRHAWDMYQDGGATKGETDRMATSDALRSAVDDKAVEEWIAGKLDGLLGEAGIYNGKDPYTSSGRQRSFSQLHYAYTLENIVKAMQETQAARGQSVWGATGKTLQAVATPEYRSIREIKADSGRLGLDEGAEYEAKLQAIDDQIGGIITKVKQGNSAHSDNSFIESDIIGGVLVETAKGKKTVDAIMRAFSKEGYKISSQTARDIQAAYQAAAEMPTGYFEAKPQRAVGFDEVLAAVIPDDSSQKLRYGLEQAGVRMLEYKTGNDTDRLAKINSVEDARFSLKTVNGKQVVWLENSPLTNKELNDHKAVADFIARHIGEVYTIVESGQRVYIGKDLPREYTQSKYTSYLRNSNRTAARAKNKAIDGMGELIETATNRRWEQTRHTDSKDAKYGMYRYDAMFAFPIMNNGAVQRVRAYDVELLIRNASNGKKYLYDIVNIKENATAQIDLTKREARLAAYKAATGDDISTDRIPASGDGVNSDTRNSLKIGTMTKGAAALMQENQLLQEKLRDFTALQKQAAKLRAGRDYWQGQTRRTKVKTKDSKAVAATAKKLIRDFYAQTDAAALQNRLQSLYDELLNFDGSTSAEELQQRLTEIAESLVESASVELDAAYNQYADLRAYCRKGVFLVPKGFNGWPAKDFNAWRKSLTGRIRIAYMPDSTRTAAENYVADGDATARYKEMAAMWPGLFNEQAQANAEDQVNQIVEVLDSIYDIEQANPFEQFLPQAVKDAEAAIMADFFSLPETKKTFADLQAEKLAQARAKGRQQAKEKAAQVKERYEGKLADQKAQSQEQLQKLREQRDSRLAELREQNRERMERLLERERTRRETALDKLRDRYAARDARTRERQTAGALREKITRHASALSQKLLRPSDKQHIPEGLRGAVAKLLQSINQESPYSYDKDGQLRKNAGGSPTVRTAAFRLLKAEYIKIADGDIVFDPSLLGSEAEGIEGDFDKVIGMADTRLADMNVEQLETLWRVIRAVEHSVSTAGKMLSGAKYAMTEEWARALKDDSAGRKPKRSLLKNHPSYDLENPYTFFSHYGESGLAIYRMLRDAQDRQQRMTDRVAEETRKLTDRKTVKRLETEAETFTTERGDALTLTRAQMLELYLLSKRQQAIGHLLKGGIVQPEVPSRKIRRGTDAILLSEKDLRTISGQLTEAERQLADALQKLTGGILADYGNAASMKAYGYRKFTETGYWPIKSAREGLHSSIEKGAGNTRAIKNIGMAKTTKPHADNPLDVSGIFSTFADHASGMIDYAAWLCPMEDASRLFNYKFRDEYGVTTGETVKGLLDKVGGSGSQDYWHRLMEDIQNGINARSDSALGELAGKAIGGFKGAAVGANLRVIIQQPTAFFRAAAVLRPADMARGLTGGATRGSGWQKALQYAPIAARKDAGGFDISSPYQMSETLFDKRTGVRRLSDTLSAPAGKAKDRRHCGGTDLQRQRARRGKEGLCACLAAGAWHEAGRDKAGRAD